MNYKPKIIVTGSARTGTSLTMGLLYRMGIDVCGEAMPKYRKKRWNPEFYECKGSINGTFDESVNDRAVKILALLLGVSNIDPSDSKVIVTIRRPSCVVASRNEMGVKTMLDYQAAFIDQYAQIIQWLNNNKITPLVIDYDRLLDEPNQLEIMAEYVGASVTQSAITNIKKNLRHHTPVYENDEAEGLYAQIAAIGLKV